MIYEFSQPFIVDTKNINNTFTKKKYVPKEFIPKIKKISKQRKTVKQTLKYLSGPKIEDVPPYNLIEEVIVYSDIVLELDSLFERDYIITKNWKWTPLLTQSPILKFSQSIKNGKSGEILMAQYAAFSVCFRSVRGDLAYLKQNLLHQNQSDLNNDLTFSRLVQKDPKVSEVEEAIYKILKAHVKAWTLLKKSYNRSKPYFKNLANYSENYIESTSAGMEITLLLTKINTNMLYTEYLRLQGNFEEMGKYAKMIVTQAFLVEDRIKAYNFYVNPKLTEFVQVSQKLYKAIALWSLFFTYLPKLKTNAYEADEDFNILAGGCISIVEEIARLHREILVLPNIRLSSLFGIVCLYFKDILVSKSKEITFSYSEVFKNHPYDEFHFNRMDELDYVSRTTGEEGH